MFNTVYVFSEEHGRLIGLFTDEVEQKAEEAFFDSRGKLIAVVQVGT